MNEMCESCGKSEGESVNGLYGYTCRLCRETYVLCDTCLSVASKEQKCIECINDGK
jgi:hypothetical protein